MLKNLIAIIFGFKFLTMLTLVLYDFLSKTSYIEIAHDSSVTLLFRSVGIILTICFAFLTYGLIRCKKWVFYLYSSILLILIIFIGWVMLMMARYESFSIITLLIATLIMLTVPVLIEIYFIRIRKTVLVK